MLGVQGAGCFRVFRVLRFPGVQGAGCSWCWVLGVQGDKGCEDAMLHFIHGRCWAG